MKPVKAEPAKEAVKKAPVKTEAIETKAGQAKAIETKKDTTKAIETRAAVLKDPEPVKEEKPVVKKAAVKKTASKTTAKKTAAKPTARTAAKKAEVKTELFLQFAGREYTQEEVLQKVKNVWTKELKNKVGDMKDVKIYLKPEEFAAYYVINGDTTGKVDL